MKSTLRHYAAAMIAALGFALPASATSYGTDYTDLWWNPNENGWGINLIQQYGTIFATLFVYGADNSPRWYVASQLEGSPNSFSGTLYQTTGPAFGAPWTGGQPPTAVGSMSLAFSGSNSGMLTYTVNGVTVSKAIQRQSFRNDNLAGPYIGGFTGIASNCSDANNNGSVWAVGEFSVQHGGTSITINLPGNTATCAYTGSYAPVGRLGAISGTYTCAAGNATTSGSFSISEIGSTTTGFSGNYLASDNLGCTYRGTFGGVRDVM